MGIKDRDFMRESYGFGHARVSMNEISNVRMYALRAFYLLNFVGLGSMAWPAVVNPAEPFGIVEGAAFSFWAAFALLMGLGLRYPLQMLPLILLQLIYKSVWLAAVALPLWSSGQWDAEAARYFRVFAIAVIIDLLVIPWSYVYANYVRKPGARWKAVSV